jgi:23S rRNA (cytosine1962-C5)-methyltransferase
MKHLRLKPREDRRLLRGHPWAYRNEFEPIPPLEESYIVDIYTDHGRFVARGFYQAQGGIAVRVLSRHQTPIDGAFWRERIDRARAFRERLWPGQDVYRWVFGESDGLPGFVADRYGPVVVCETPCAFYGPHAAALAECFMKAEGVAGVKIIVAGEATRHGELAADAACRVEGVSVSVALEGGQKTGLFLDQRLNSLAARRYCSGARVLDGHCYVGTWSCHAALAGASSVLGIDTSGPAVERAAINARLNGVDSVCSFERADVMEALQRGERYDVAILDPPAFAKGRAQMKKALALYQALNRTALEALAPGGILITSTCSHFVGRDAFLEVLKRSATSAQRQGWVLDVSGAAPDHPVMMSMPETEYLTCVTLRAD